MLSENQQLSCGAHQGGTVLYSQPPGPRPAGDSHLQRGSNRHYNSNLQLASACIMVIL